MTEVVRNSLKARLARGEVASSMTVRLSPSAPEGFLVFSHAGDDFAACRDHVRTLLGLAAGGWKGERQQPTQPEPATENILDEAKIASALSSSAET